MTPRAAAQPALPHRPWPHGHKKTRRHRPAGAVGSPRTLSRGRPPRGRAGARARHAPLPATDARADPRGGVAGPGAPGDGHRHRGAIAVGGPPHGPDGLGDRAAPGAGAVRRQDARTADGAGHRGALRAARARAPGAPAVAAAGNGAAVVGRHIVVAGGCPAPRAPVIAVAGPEPVPTNPDVVGRGCHSAVLHARGWRIAIGGVDRGAGVTIVGIAVIHRSH